MNQDLAKIEKSKSIIFSQSLIYNLVYIDNTEINNKSKKLVSENSIRQTEADYKIEKRISNRVNSKRKLARIRLLANRILISRKNFVLILRDRLALKDRILIQKDRVSVPKDKIPALKNVVPILRDRALALKDKTLIPKDKLALGDRALILKKSLILRNIRLDSGRPD